jgi:tRNA acetyltransferase TAN1
MPKDFNLLATTSRGNERDACAELQYLLGQIGDATVEINRSRISGIVLAKTTLNPTEAVERLRTVLHERPYEFRYTLRLMPVDSIVRTDLNEIRKRTAELASGIGENETFRITLEKRFTSLHSREIIDTVAKDIKRKVDLTKPDKVLLIEVVGGSTGISLVKPENTLSVLKEKMR